ncbi:hypothetical protein [Paenibacillus sp. M-152]|uniref:hypothetical protein n=1 Tax=Paenibacillus sp. M-152 TaxID=2487928 RepID=UPI000F700099|nr:hypothetical protein [Paenibacillus sp. M-152]AZH30607.1 hypothetical protein EGM68_18465 [Paenibacillus sp. M-152]
MGREKVDSNFEQLPFEVRNWADLIVIMDSGKLNTGAYEISGAIEVKGERASSGKRERCEKEWLLIV